MKLSKIEIITGMSKLTGLKSVLSRAGVRGMTVVQVPVSYTHLTLPTT